jgi:hypothetical protein
MCTRIAAHPDGILDLAAGHMWAAQAKWGRRTPEDHSGIRNKQDLITRVEERYSLSHAVATQDVQLWDADVRGENEAGRHPLAVQGVVT